MIVATTKGKIRGVETDYAYVYKGVPYAKPPMGELRWHAPVPCDHWDGIYEATLFQNRCPQPGQQPGSFYEKEFFSNPEFLPPVSEDCLYLNIWVPKIMNGPCPVAIWYHGGGFINGHSTEIEFDGDVYAKRGIILITVNYRLGIFGFCCHEKLKERDGHSGNYGLLDQIAAIDWVRENIASFGGDPGNITIFGQSAGGMSVRCLVSSPMVVGKVHKAILQSCNGYRGGMKSEFNCEKMQILWRKFLNKKELPFEEFCNLPTEKLLKLSNSFIGYAFLHTFSTISMTPVVDGHVLPAAADEAVDNGTTLSIPYMVGVTKDDIGVSRAGKKDHRKNELLQSLERWCIRHSQRGIDCYTYYFKRNLPGDKAGAFHSSELWYIFGTLGRSWRPMEQHDYELSEKMIDAWAAFIHTGNPGWETYKNNGDYIHIFE